jgi:hypothetical protein
MLGTKTLCTELAQNSTYRGRGTINLVLLFLDMLESPVSIKI